MTRPAYDVAVVGAGVVGTAVARELALCAARVVLLEANSDVGAGTSKANTAILHTGFDATPGTLEARLVARGQRLLAGYCAAAGIAVEHTGALLVAWTEDQVAALPGIVAKAARNGYSRLSPVPAAELYQREPHLGPGALAGLAVAGEGLVDPWSPPIAFARDALRAGAEVRLGAPVHARSGGDPQLLSTPAGPVAARWVVNAAGLAADRVDAMFGYRRFTVTPRRGQLLVFDKLARRLLSAVLLPVPTARTKGVLVAPTVFGNVLVGPTAEDLADRTDTATTAEGIASLLAAAGRILPALRAEGVTAAYAGLRAATEHADYQLDVDPAQRYAAAGGIRSTGLTAALAIAEELRDRLADAGLALGPRRELAPTAMPPLGERQRRPYLDRARIRADPDYGRIACHCERVTWGEVRDALSAPLPARDPDGLRRRTRALTGRCQGFSCSAALLARLAKS